MSELEVPGATLYYEVNGHGPLLLCIPGGNGTCEIYKPLAMALQEKFTVVTYDRRGFSRSLLTGAQDYEHRLARDADDAAALIKHHSPNEPAIVLGNSSGAIVSLKLLLRHPDLIKLLISHEPPLMRRCPNWPELKAKNEALYATYRRAGPFPALEEFCDMVMVPKEGATMITRFDPRLANVQYWLEREVIPYPFEDLTAQMLQPHREKLLFANAELTNKEALQYQANVALAKDLEMELAILPGGHVGFASHCEDFAPAFLDALKKNGTI